MKTISNKSQFVKNIIAIAAITGLIIWAVLAKRYGYVYLFTALAFLMIVGILCSYIAIKSKRRQGIYPQKGKATMADVKRLALDGHTTLAIRAYREIHNVTLRKAKQKVNKILSI